MEAHLTSRDLHISTNLKHQRIKEKRNATQLVTPESRRMNLDREINPTRYSPTIPFQVKKNTQTRYSLFHCYYHKKLNRVSEIQILAPTYII
jgi:hypothetical protein